MSFPEASDLIQINGSYWQCLLKVIAKCATTTIVRTLHRITNVISTAGVQHVLGTLAMQRMCVDGIENVSSGLAGL